jgi:hypothetical protein
MDNPDLSAELEILQKEICDRRGSLMVLSARRFSWVYAAGSGGYRGTGSQRPTRLEHLGRPRKGEVVEKKEPRPWVDFFGPLQERDTFQRSKRTVELRSVCCRSTGIRGEQSSEASSAWCRI